LTPNGIKQTNFIAFPANLGNFCADEAVHFSRKPSERPKPQKTLEPAQFQPLGFSAAGDDCMHSTNAASRRIVAQKPTILGSCSVLWLGGIDNGTLRRGFGAISAAYRRIRGWLTDTLFLRGIHCRTLAIFTNQSVLCCTATCSRSRRQPTRA
jgi:hypothetical protein